MKSVLASLEGRAKERQTTLGSALRPSAPGSADAAGASALFVGAYVAACLICAIALVYLQMSH